MYVTRVLLCVLTTTVKHWSQCWARCFTARGNTTVCGEFNFVADPEAAYIVLDRYTCPTYIATWEFSGRNSLPWVCHYCQMNIDDDKRYHTWKGIQTDEMDQTVYFLSCSSSFSISVFLWRLAGPRHRQGSFHGEDFSPYERGARTSPVFYFNSLYKKRLIGLNRGSWSRCSLLGSNPWVLSFV